MRDKSAIQWGKIAYPCTQKSFKFVHRVTNFKQFTTLKLYFPML